MSNHHQAVDVRDIGMGTAKDFNIAAHSRSHQQVLLSADFDFADVRIYRPEDHFGIVIIDRPDDAVVSKVLEILDRFLAHKKIAANLAGRLVIVDERRIRIRPPLADE